MKPFSLSYSYLIGSERKGTSIRTLISCGGLRPGGSLLMSIGSAPVVVGSGPGNRGRQRHQDRLRVAAGPQPELRAPIVEEVELNVAPAADQLVLSLLGRPGPVHVPAHQLRVDVEEGLAHGPGEGEGLLDVVFQIVVE